MDTSVIYLTVEELAKAAGVTPRQVRVHVKEGLLDNTVGQETGMQFSKREEEMYTRVRRKTCTKLLFTPDQVEAYVDLMKDYRSEDNRKNNKGGHTTRAKKGTPGYSCELVAKFCGTATSTIRTAVKAGHLKTLKGSPIRISKYTMEKYKVALDDRMLLPEAAGLLKVTVSAVRSMIHSGRIKQVFAHLGNTYVSGEAIIEMAKQYEETHREVPDGVQPTMRRLK